MFGFGKIPYVSVLVCVVLCVYSCHGDYVANLARTTTASSNECRFYDASVDRYGNVYAAGYIKGSVAFTFDTGVTATGSSGGENIVLVRYNASTGVANNAKTMTSGLSANFDAVTTDSTGNIFVVGWIYGTGTYTFGSTVTAVGSAANRNNPVIVKYDSSMAAQWAKSTTASADTAEFNDVAIDPSGNIYAVGYITGTTTYSFSGSVQATGIYASGKTAVLVKYNAAGVAQWVSATLGGVSDSRFSGIAIDPSTNIYVGGYIYGNSEYSFGSSANVTGSDNMNNAVLAKYDSNGVAIYAKSVESTANPTFFTSVATDSSGNVYCGGNVNNAADFGNSVTVTGGYNNGNALVVKYDASLGVAQWARSTTTATTGSIVTTIATDSAGNVFAGGRLTNAASFAFGNGISVSSTSTSYNPITLMYNSSGSCQFAKSISAPSAAVWDEVYGVDIEQATGAVFTAGTIGGTSTTNFGDGVTARGTHTTYNPLLGMYYDCPCQHGGVCDGPFSCDCSATSGVWGGDLCEVCQCEHSGVCDSDTTCDCTATVYGGPHCSACTCQHSGTCSSDTTCDCSATVYNGTLCDSCICEHSGVCDSDTTCDCTSTAYNGTICASCACEHGGSCSSDTTCDCSSTVYGGTLCDGSCLCEHGGTCSGDTCDCSPTVYDGFRCATCGCDHGGSCVNDTACDCSSTVYEGTLCDGSCLCEHGGSCSGDTCDCSPTVYDGFRCATCGCQNGGNCSSDTTCDCSSSDVYNGTLCDICICEHGGTCSGNSCDCDNTVYSGQLCDGACKCEHGGVCSGDNECDCDATVYDGRFCTNCMCENNGWCKLDTECECSPTAGFTGTYCEIPPESDQSIGSQMSLSVAVCCCGVIASMYF